MKRLAICLGLTQVDPERYEGWCGFCPGADRDAARFAELCHDRGFDGVTVLVNQAASSANIKAAFIEAAKSLKPDDLLVLYNSGHGGQLRDVDGDEADGSDETLCWHDGEVSDDRLAGFLCRLPKGVRVLTLADTCNSGTSFRGRGKQMSARATKKFRGSLLHFGGCDDGRESYGADEGGAWTIALLETLDKARKTLSYQDWFTRAAKRMSRRQVPVLGEWGKESFLSREALT
jgi:hypothetical protein